jgi:hypothetical protein
MNFERNSRRIGELKASDTFFVSRDWILLRKELLRRTGESFDRLRINPPQAYKTV